MQSAHMPLLNSKRSTLDGATQAVQLAAVTRLNPMSTLDHAMGGPWSCYQTRFPISWMLTAGKMVIPVAFDGQYPAVWGDQYYAP